MRGLKHKNVAAELLAKLLRDELKLRARSKLVQSRLFSEKLQRTLNGYHNRAISTMEVIEELIRLNRRYTPYAGFPGKPIRFLESLLLYKKSVAKDEVKKSRISLGKSEIIRHFCMETGMQPFMFDPAIPVYFEQVRSIFYYH